MSKVTIGFLKFAVQPAAAILVRPGIIWLAVAVPSLDSHDWRHSLEDDLIVFLHTCWELESERISSDSTLQAAFLSLLATASFRTGVMRLLRFGIA